MESERTAPNRDRKHYTIKDHDASVNAGSSVKITGISSTVKTCPLPDRAKGLPLGLGYGRGDNCRFRPRDGFVSAFVCPCGRFGLTRTFRPE